MSKFHQTPPVHLAVAVKYQLLVDQQQLLNAVVNATATVAQHRASAFIA